MAQTQSRAPQVAAAQSSPTTSGPTSAPAGPARAGASNGVAQEKLEASQGRTFTQLSPGMVLESRTEVDKLANHVGALWGQLTAQAAGRVSLTPETPIGSFESSGLATTLRDRSLSGELAQRAGWVSEWVDVGAMGVPGADGLFNTPFAKAQIEIHVLAGDLEALQTAQGSMSTNTGFQAGSAATSGAEAGVGMNGVSAKVSGSESQTAGSSGGATRSMPMQMTAYRGRLAFDCTVRVKRTFGPAESRSGRLVAGEALLSSALGFGA